MDLDQEWHARLSSLSMKERRRVASSIEPIIINGVRAPIAASPMLVQTANVRTSVDLFLSFALRAEAHALSNKNSLTYRRLYDSLTGGGKYMVDVCNYESEFSRENRFRRIDAFLSEENSGLKIIEMNQAAPLAISFYERTKEFHTALSGLIDIKFDVPSIAEELALWFFEEYEQRYSSKKEKLKIGLVVEQGYPAKFIDLPVAKKMIEDAARKLGRQIDFVWCEPPDVSIQMGSVYCKGIKVDMIWRNTVYLEAYPDGIEDYKQLYASQDEFLQVNSTLSWLTRSKELFALAWSDEICDEIGLIDAEKSELRSVIPETYNLFYGVSPSKLRDDVEWICKPSDSGFGKGIVFSSDENLWREAIKKATSGPGYVVQRRVNPISRNFSLINIDSGELNEISLEVDYDPYIIGTRKNPLALVRGLISGDDNQLKKMNIVEGAIISIAWHREPQTSL